MRSIYLVQFSYAPDAWRRMTDTPSTRNRDQAVANLLAKFHGCLGEIKFPECGFDVPAFRKGFIEGQRRVIALIAFEHKLYAEAFGVYVVSEAGVLDLVMTPLTTMDDMDNALTITASVKSDKSLKYAKP